ncbi:unnamed protein product [Nesidiocoris tenuis]|uniref:Uncharacterized protein n=1 Tax=Nesidiocoris tenuis TaxID=355587 RepID=A0A6H5HJJ6_9HEMI|nr:unnamed protein product [Nesidiocoris tenuis]
MTTTTTASWTQTATTTVKMYLKKRRFLQVSTNGRVEEARSSKNCHRCPNRTTDGRSRRRPYSGATCQTTMTGRPSGAPSSTPGLRCKDVYTTMMKMMDETVLKT